jgi:tetratricopeptide (TPR) repeat protein
MIALIGVMVIGTASAYLIWRLIPSAHTTHVQAQVLAKSGKYDRALDLLRPAYKRALWTADKALMLSDLAANSQSQGDSKAALDYYQQLDRIEPNQYSTLVNIANAATREGNTVLASDAYRKALALLEKGTKGPLTDQNIAQIQEQVQATGATK